VLRDVPWQPLSHPGASERVDEERDVRRSGTGDRRRCVLEALIEDDGASDLGRERPHQIDLLLVRLASTAHDTHAFTHHRRRIRHDAHDRSPGRQKRFESSGRDSRSYRNDERTVEQRGELGDDLVDMLRLDGEQDDEAEGTASVAVGTQATP